MGRSTCSVCDGVCQSIALVKEPSNWRALLDPMGHWKGPAGGHRYRIGTKSEKDNWWSVASKDGWGDPWDLIDFNFKTRNPEEVNWYLYHFLGCRVSLDRKNFSFDKASPGILYTKKNHYAIPMPAAPPAVPVSPKPLFKRGLTWFGAGVQVGGMGLTSGAAAVLAFVFNLDDPGSYFWLEVPTRRTGWGAGASIAGMAVVITGLYDPYTVAEAPSGSFDFDISLGGRWGSLVKTVDKIPNTRYLLRLARYIGGNVRPKLIGESATAAKLAIKAAGISVDSNDLEVHMLEIPFLGAGLQGSIYYGESTYIPHGVHVTPEEEFD
ncbi:MAG: hypothetical protein JNK48_26595 [Bryobacterales bacterium]|nr:hypothetical protein [Bryobacterales bacterium]